MTQHRVRTEWIDEPRVLPGAVETDVATMATFAYESTGVVLAVEPRLAGLALMVEGIARGGAVDETMWRAVDAIAALLVGPGRSATQVTAVTNESRAVASELRGEVIQRRYSQALRGVAAETSTS